MKKLLTILFFVTALNVGAQNIWRAPQQFNVWANFSGQVSQLSGTDSLYILTDAARTQIVRNSDYIKVGIINKDNPAVYVGNGNSVNLSDSAVQIQFDTMTLKRATDSLRIVLANGTGSIFKDSGFIAMNSVGSTIGKQNAYQVGGYSNNAQITQTSTDTITFRFSGDTAHVSAGVTAWQFTPPLSANSVNAWGTAGNSSISSATNFIGSTNNASMRFKTNNTYRMVIDSTGNTGIGTQAPKYKLDVAGVIAAQDSFKIIHGTDSFRVYLTDTARIVSNLPIKIGGGSLVVNPGGSVVIDAGLKFTDGTPGAGKVLASDASGNAAWTATGAVNGQTRTTLTGPQGTMYNGQLSVTVSAGDLTVALKTLSGGDPSTTDTVFVRIGNSLRWVTSALSVTKNDGTNWCNAGAASLATAEIDYFAYLGYNATDGVVIGFSRIVGNQYSDFSTTSTNEKYCAISTITNAAATDFYSVIGRFAATLSAGAAYTWTVPTFTAINLINRPIFETRFLNMIATTASLVGWSVLTTANITYQVRQKSVIYHHNIQGTSDNNTTTLPLPISLSTATGAAGTYYTFSQDNGTVSGVGGRGVISTAAPTIITLTNSPDGIAYTNVGTKISSCITIQYVTD